MHISVGKLIIIGSDIGLSPDRCHAIIWTNAGLLSIGPLLIYFSENLIKIQQFSLRKMHMKMSPAKWHPSCLGLIVLIRPDVMELIHLRITMLMFVNLRANHVIYHDSFRCLCQLHDRQITALHNSSWPFRKKIFSLILILMISSGQNFAVWFWYWLSHEVLVLHMSQ